MSDQRVVLRWSVPIIPGPQTVQVTDASVPLEVAPARDGSGTIDLWTLSEPGRPPLDWRVLVVGTGVPVDAAELGYVSHIGSVIDADNQVWHVFLLVA